MTNSLSIEDIPVEQVQLSSLAPPDSPRLAGENPHHTRVLAQLDAQFPPILVHRGSMKIIDGLHRFRAADLKGQRQIDVRFFDGSEDDAFVLAVTSNISHGLPLSLADRRAAALRILVSHPNWSDRAVAATTRLAPRTVSRIRAAAQLERS